MLVDEAHWVAAALDQLDSHNLSPLLNVGSATAEFREQIQPWIDEIIFAPLRERGIVIHHTDVQNGNGIDFKGDLTDDTFVAMLSARQYSALLCCNVLEHVANPAEISSNLESMLRVGGSVLVTVPNRFPYHPDPIDTMFRPELKDLVALFPRCELLKGEVIDCGTGWDYFGRDLGAMFTTFRRRLGSMSQHGGVKGSSSFLPWFFRHFRQTCALLRRVR